MVTAFPVGHRDPETDSISDTDISCDNESGSDSGMRLVEYPDSSQIVYLAEAAASRTPVRSPAVTPATTPICTPVTRTHVMTPVRTPATVGPYSRTPMISPTSSLVPLTTLILHLTVPGHIILDRKPTAIIVKCTEVTAAHVLWMECCKPVQQFSRQSRKIMLGQ